MDILSEVRRLRTRVKEHGNYAEIAKVTGLSLSLIQKFATEDKLSYKTDSIQALAEFFNRRRAAPRKRKARPMREQAVASESA